MLATIALYGWEEQGKIPREDVALRSLNYCLWFSLLTAAVAEMTNLKAAAGQG